MCLPTPRQSRQSRRSRRPRARLRERRQFSGELVSSQNFVPYIRDFPGAGGASAFATLGPRAAAAARADDPGRLRQGVLDPRDVEYVRDRAQRLRHWFWNARLATALQAILEQRIDDLVAVGAIRIQRGR